MVPVVLLMVSLATVVFGQADVECDVNTPDDQTCETITPRECYDYRTKKVCCMKCMELVNPDLPEECAFGDKKKWFLGPGRYSSCENVKDRCDYCKNRRTVRSDCCASCSKYCSPSQLPSVQTSNSKEPSFKRLLRILKDTIAMVED